MDRLAVGGQIGNFNDLYYLSHFQSLGEGISIPIRAALICTPRAFVAFPCRTRLSP
jgi:hypothetical protein